MLHAQPSSRHTNDCLNSMMYIQPPGLMKMRSVHHHEHHKKQPVHQTSRGVLCHPHNAALPHEENSIVFNRTEEGRETLPHRLHSRALKHKVSLFKKWRLLPEVQGQWRSHRCYDLIIGCGHPAADPTAPAAAVEKVRLAFTERQALKCSVVQPGDNHWGHAKLSRTMLSEWAR